MSKRSRASWFLGRSAIAKLSLPDLEKILVATLTGMSVEEFTAEAKKWLTNSKDPRWKRPYTDLIYQPMLEAMQYLRGNGFKTYIVTGGGQDFVRVYSQRVYDIPPEQVVGTAGGTDFSRPEGGAPSDARDVRRRHRRYPDCPSLCHTGSVRCPSRHLLASPPPSEPDRPRAR